MINWNEYPLNLLSKAQVEKAVSTSSYEILDINARELLSPNRFDVYAKLLYIDHKVKGVDISYAMNVYKKHIDVITGYTFSEYGQPNKDSFEKYVECFNKLIDTFQKGGYDPSLSLIPVDADYVPIDGSHRVSCAVYFNQKIRVVKFVDYRRSAFSSQWFKEHHLLETIQNSISLEFCNWHSDIYMACLWPNGCKMKKQREEALQLLEQNFPIVSICRHDLGQNGLRNLLIQVYGFMSWTGNANNHFSGVYHKLNEISTANNSVVDFILFQASNLDKVLKVKDQIRDIFKIDKGAIHITDNTNETVQIANLIYNQNSIHHLKYACPDKFLHSYNMCMDFKSLLLNNGYDLSHYIIDSSSVMAMYGIREAGDLDYLTIETDDKKQLLHSIKQGSMECNDKFLIYHGIPVEDMVFNPQNYFVFNELRFLSLERIKIFKRNKAEEKDLLDIRLINSFLSINDKYVYKILLLKNYYRRKKAYLINCMKKMIRTILLKIHILDLVKRMIGRKTI